ncbi:MAG: D-alanine--D-alanine ligase [Planctomycetes bacterium]|nr:D-alanine--D-alanine ligase [Planctomycetota bacterium]
MRVGLTYDLRDEYIAAGFTEEQAAEFDKPETIDALEQSIARIGHSVDRIGNIMALVNRLAGGDRWDLVFNIAEGAFGYGREAQVPALLDAYGIPATFGDALCMTMCLHKGYAKHVVAGMGVPTPRFCVIDNDRMDYACIDLQFPLFVKPVAEGTGKGISAKAKIEKVSELRGICEQLMQDHQQAVLVEEYLPGREFTVGITGTGKKARVLGVMEVVLLDNAEPGAYTFENKENYLDRVSYRLADDDEAVEAAEVALSAYKALDCRDAGRVDIRSDSERKPHFMEANPLAGLNPTHSDLPILCRLLGYDYDRLIAGILASAGERV